MPSSRWTSARSRSRGSTTTVAPIRAASARRTGLGSLTTTNRAPAWRTIAVAIRPIGPAPVISTSSPSTGNASAVCTALPNGSKIAATSMSMPGQWCQTLVIGSATYSANAPSRPTPRPVMWAHRCRRPARQWRHSPHVTWPSPLTMSPGLEVVDVRADLDDLADELVAHDQRRVDRLRGPGVPALDVQVGAADPGPVDPDQDVVDPDLRVRDGLEREPGAGGGLHEGEHRRSCFRGSPGGRSSRSGGPAAGRRSSRRSDSPPRRCPRSRTGRDRRARGTRAGPGTRRRRPACRWR